MSTLAPERPRARRVDGVDATAPTGVEGATARPLRRTEPARRPGRHLRSVPRKRRNPAVPALVAVGVVIVALFGLAGMHAVLIGGQIDLDAMRRDVASETEEIRRLQLRVAELESPERVLDAARARLGMVAPDEVGYLLPVGVPGGPDAPVRVDASTAPPPPEPISEATAPGPVGPTDDATAGAASTDGGGDDASVPLAEQVPDEGGREG